MGIFAGIDGGGTKTRCWIADETRVLGRASCGTVKLMNVGEKIATGRLQELVRIAAKDAGVGPEAVERTCVGLAGISSESVRGWAESTLREVVGGEVLLLGDEQIALDAAFEGGPGVLVIAGTGSHVVGRCADGSLHTAGGWGPVVGDEGSGTWIGMEAIRAGLHAVDRCEESVLLGEIAAFWNLDEEDGLGELVAKANQRPRPDFADLAELVAQCADEGDALARRVLERAGEELAAQVRLVVEKMLAAGCAAEDAARLAFTGSVLEKIAAVRGSMERCLPGVTVMAEAVEPLKGALWRARRGDGPAQV